MKTPDELAGVDEQQAEYAAATTGEPCRCWTNTHALGHEGHCCFLRDNRVRVSRAQAWRDRDDICHRPGEST